MDVTREQTVHAFPTRRREVYCSSGSGCGLRGPIWWIPKHQRCGALILVVNFARSRHGGPPWEVAEPREGLKRSSLVSIVIRGLDGNSVVLLVLLCKHTGGTLDVMRGDIKNLVVGRAFAG